mmetsp:Transcript_41716/g.126574  ORF Transcript_41716/g.126574 Transcript_41716/m.126574 type:complete len:267 (-) Transcript_41716:671-1471(-)
MSGSERSASPSPTPPKPAASSGLAARPPPFARPSTSSSSFGVSPSFIARALLSDARNKPIPSLLLLLFRARSSCARTAPDVVPILAVRDRSADIRSARDRTAEGSCVERIAIASSSKFDGSVSDGDDSCAGRGNSPDRDVRRDGSTLSILTRDAAAAAASPLFAVITVGSVPTSSIREAPAAGRIRTSVPSVTAASTATIAGVRLRLRRPVSRPFSSSKHPPSSPSGTTTGAYPLTRHGTPSDRSEGSSDLSSITGARASSIGPRA